ncbi:MAG: carboxymuconolactone decarboxylase family protein [Pseudomonadales bacterium]|nr:carboxymuconolactone decarboxylase family protein [Pseudomonadales bacterium]
MTTLLHVPLPPYEAESQALLERFPTARGETLALFRMLTLSPRIMRRVLAGGLLDRDSPLTLRQRELVIWRVCARCGCAYEWGVHVSGFGRAAGLQAGLAEASLRPLPPTDDGSLNAEIRLLWAVVDALHETGNLDDDLRHRLADAFPPAAQLEILALAGFYHSISYFANVARLAPEPFAGGFPDGRGGRFAGASR